MQFYFCEGPFEGARHFTLLLLQPATSCLELQDSGCYRHPDKSVLSVHGMNQGFLFTHLITLLSSEALPPEQDPAEFQHLLLTGREEKFHSTASTGVLLSTSTKPRVLLSSTNRVCQELIFNMNQGQQKAITSTTDSKGEVCKIP
ncbi:hypothetical protein Q9966_006152 [Columba livia]|nr:hypothetical protein Q9966_006152 [Columba livia]